MVPAAVLFSSIEKEELLEKVGWKLLDVVPPDEPLPPDEPELVELSAEEEPPPPPPPQELRRKRVMHAVKSLLINVRDILLTKWRTHRDSNPEPPA
tara:strand:- start:178 stop:465 length:288 start_codon:yes stop_codon:yes gene_type:complete